MIYILGEIIVKIIISFVGTIEFTDVIIIVIVDDT